MVVSPCLAIGLIWISRASCFRGLPPTGHALSDVLGSIIWDRPGMKHVLYGSTIIICAVLLAARLDGVKPDLSSAVIAAPLCVAMTAEAALVGVLWPL